MHRPWDRTVRDHRPVCELIAIGNVSCLDPDGYGWFVSMVLGVMDNISLLGRRTPASDHGGEPSGSCFNEPIYE